MGCPDSVVSALEGTEGIRRVFYSLEKDLFEVEYNSGEISIEEICLNIEEAGRRMGHSYRAFTVSSEDI
jgi:copper chaperone CopZ